MRSDQLKPWKEMQECLPGLSSYEQVALKRSLKEHSGVEIPVLALPDGRIIDGHHRQKLGGGQCRIQVMDISEEKALALGIALNIARRQLSNEQIEETHKRLAKNKEARKQAAIELVNNQGKTQAQAAALVGVSRQTVGGWLDEDEAAKDAATKAAAEEETTNAKNGISCKEKKPSKKPKKEPKKKRDHRVTIPREQHPIILKRRELGESAKKIAADYKVTEEAINKIIRNAKAKEPTAKPEPIKGKYRVFYADPPWQYRDSGQFTETDAYGRAERHYRTMSIDELCQMGDDIKKCSEKDAVLFLWVTSPLLEECFPVIKAWGFKYKTSFVWDKVRHNFGHYNSVRHEFLLICTRGSCTPDEKEKVPSVVSIERTKEHSQKPKEFREIIDRLYTRGQRIELFAREKPEGGRWETWGNQPNTIKSS